MEIINWWIFIVISEVELRSIHVDANQHGYAGCNYLKQRSLNLEENKAPRCFKKSQESPYFSRKYLFCSHLKVNSLAVRVLFKGENTLLN